MPTTPDSQFARPSGETPVVVVLAGGEGQRIGGGKPLRRLGADTLIARAVARARSWSAMVAISVRTPGLAGDLPLLVDDPEIDGPLAGLRSALRHAASLGRESVLTLPCDTPFLPDDLPQRLAAALGDACTALPSSNGQVHPACGLWRLHAASRLDAYLATGRRSLYGFAEFAGHAVVDWPVGRFDPFFNINDERDLRTAEAWLARGS